MAHEEVELEEESRSTILDTSVSKNSKIKEIKKPTPSWQLLWAWVSAIFICLVSTLQERPVVL